MDTSKTPAEFPKQTLGLVPRMHDGRAVDQSKRICSADLRQDDLTGLSLAQYALGKKIGEGGMGHVYLATHMHLGKQFAIKFIRPELMGSEAKDRFLNEIQSIGKMSHLHLVNAVDAGQHDQLLYCVTDYLVGSDVGELVQARGPMPIQAAAEVIRQAAIGLDYAHHRGYVHRDVKPSNLFVEANANVRILDFGIAKHQDTNEQYTRAGQILGTVDFISPEQASNASRATAQSDLYSLGATLAYLLTGELIFSDKQFPTVTNKLAAIVTQVPPIVETSVKLWPKPIQIALAKTLAIEPSRRFENALELAKILEPIASLQSLQQWLSQSEKSEFSPHGLNHTIFGKVSSSISTRSKIVAACVALLSSTFLFCTFAWPSTETQSPETKLATQTETSNVSTIEEQTSARQLEQLTSYDTQKDLIPDLITVVPRTNATSNANAIGVRMKAAVPQATSTP